VDNNRRVLSAQEIEDRAADARALLGSKVFKDALADTEAEYVRQLIQADVGSLTAAAAHASMKVLDGVRNTLQTYINEATMQQRK
jgi:hypothetical protein